MAASLVFLAQGYSAAWLERTFLYIVLLGIMVLLSQLNPLNKHIFTQNCH